jgi:hypothetical protein
MLTLDVLTLDFPNRLSHQTEVHAPLSLAHSPNPPFIFLAQPKSKLPLSLESRFSSTRRILRLRQLFHDIVGLCVNLQPVECQLGVACCLTLRNVDFGSTVVCKIDFQGTQGFRRQQRCQIVYFRASLHLRCVIMILGILVIKHQCERTLCTRQHRCIDVQTTRFHRTRHSLHNAPLQHRGRRINLILPNPMIMNQLLRTGTPMRDTSKLRLLPLSDERSPMLLP